jgi:hypothetical protein
MAMPTQTAELFLLEDLEDAGRTSGLSESDLDGLRAIAEWITTYVTQPHEELVGHAGPVCPFLPGSVERKSLWLAPERIGEANVVELMRGYKRLLLEQGDGDDDIYDVIAVVFSDLPAERAQGVFGEVIEQLAVPSYAEDGVLFGPYYAGNEATALYNPGFRPFESPVPFMFVRHGVVGDWKFFLDDDEWLGLWAHRFGESATHALAEEVRRLPWREPTAP